jgi:hypothetical protein
VKSIPLPSRLLGCSLLALAACGGGNTKQPAAAMDSGADDAGSDAALSMGRDAGGAGKDAGHEPDGGAVLLDGAMVQTDSGMPEDECAPGSGGNPFVAGWYADPDMKRYGDTYWVYPTYSAPYDDQTYLDAFSSPDLVHWTKHARVLDTSSVTWAKRAIWAPSPIERDGKYYLYFGANDIQGDNELGGIGVGKSDQPGGPFVDAIGAPLIGAYHNGAQPIDQNVFIDDDGQAYLYYGGHGHCNVVKLNQDMISIGMFGDGSTYKEITPEGYVEGALMFKRNGKYYMMWSEGGWTGPDYRVSYAIAAGPTGPFDKLGTILSQNAAIGTGSGHNTVVNVPNTDDWYIFYHRHPLGESDGNHRVLAYDRLVFRADGTIQPVQMSEQDNFCDGDDLGWKQYGGTFAVQDGRYAVKAEGEAKSLLNVNFAELVFDALVQVGASGDAGLVFRASAGVDGTAGFHGYYLGLDVQNHKAVLSKCDGESYHELSSVDRAFHPGGTRVHIVAKGADIAIYLDGADAPALSASDGDYTTGQAGVLARGAEAKFDRVELSTPPLTTVTFYQDGGYGGASVSLGAGSYTLAQLEAAGIPDNWMSSLTMPDGYKVEVYDGDDFTGTMWTFSASNPGIPGDANDKMTSAKIFAP